MTFSHSPGMNAMNQRYEPLQGFPGHSQPTEESMKINVYGDKYLTYPILFLRLRLWNGFDTIL